MMTKTLFYTAFLLLNLGFGEVWMQKSGLFGLPDWMDGYKARLRQIESGGNDRAYNKHSKAAGRYQFIPSTARAYGIMDPYDAAQQELAIGRFTADNIAHLKRVLGRDPTPGEVYLAHQQGMGGASKLLSNPNALAADVVGNRAVTLNGGTPDMTAGEFAAKWMNKFSDVGRPTIAAREPSPPVSQQSPIPIPASAPPQQMRPSIMDFLPKGNGKPHSAYKRQMMNAADKGIAPTAVARMLKLLA